MASCIMHYACRRIPSVSVMKTYLMLQYNIYNIHVWYSYTIIIKIFTHIETSVLTLNSGNYFTCWPWYAEKHVNKSGKISATEKKKTSLYTNSGCLSDDFFLYSFYPSYADNIIHDRKSVSDLSMCLCIYLLQ